MYTTEQPVDNQDIDITEQEPGFTELVTVLPPRDIVDVPKLVGRVADREAHEASLAGRRFARRADAVGSQLARIPELYGYERRGEFYAEIKELHALTTEIEQTGTPLPLDSPWRKLGVQSEQGQAAFEQAYCTTKRFGSAELDDKLNPYEPWMADHDADNLSRLRTCLVELERRGYTPLLTEMGTPHITTGAVARIARSQEGFPHFVRPYVVDGFVPVTTKADREDVLKDYEKALAKLAKKHDADSPLYQAAQTNLDKERELTLDISSSLDAIDGMTELCVRLGVDKPIKDEDMEFLVSAQDALGNIRRQYAVTQILEDYYGDAISKPMNVLLSSAVGAGVLGSLHEVPGMPDWFLQASAGYSDDLVALFALLLSAGKMSRKEWAIQGSVGVAGLIGFGELTRQHMDSLADSGSEVKVLGAGAIFGVTALGVATVGNTILGIQNGRKFQQLAEDYKLQAYMPLTSELRTELPRCETLEEAIELIWQDPTICALEESQQNSITQRLQSLHPDDWRAELTALITPPTSWESFRDAVSQNPVQGFLYEASAIMFGVDVLAAGHAAHLIPVLAIVGSAEGGVAWLIYKSAKYQALRRLQRLATDMYLSRHFTRAAVKA